jgi:rhamnose utilization protein RhaD (predicted bifunctional aldolase and dehydrogenase)
VAPLMTGLNWAFVPYARPGLQLSRAIRAVIQHETNVLLLQNHGLAVAGETVAEAAGLLREVVGRLQRKVQPLPPLNLAALMQTAPEGFHAPANVNAHGFAVLPWATHLACNNVYYPDHAVFLGTRMPESPQPGSPVAVVPGQGVHVRNDAKPAVEPMLGCLTDVFSRLSPDDKLKALTPEEIALLLDWDAEKYRQSLKLG